jgi:ribosome-binding protein aMBF1 (putative translation factor)
MLYWDSVRRKYTGRRGSVMARKKVGELIKEARTGAGMTQEQLARKVKGVSA